MGVTQEQSKMIQGISQLTVKTLVESNKTTGGRCGDKMGTTTTAYRVVQVRQV
jgi:hypothetical protein